MKIFRQLRWKLTLSYTLVTIGAFLVIFLIMAGMVFYQLFIPENYLSPERLLDDYLMSDTPSLLDHVLSQSPIDTKMVDYLLENPEMIVSSSELLRIGGLQFSVSTHALVRIVLLGADGTILGTYRGGGLENEVGHPIDASRIPGLEAPLKAALTGETDSSRLYTMIEPNRRFVLAFPVFKQTGAEEEQVLGAVVIFFDSLPTQADVPSYLGQVAGRILLVFILGVGIMGTLFGYLFAHGLASRFNSISTITDRWSEGDFSKNIEDSTGDEISLLAQRLNNMAKQLQNLLRRRQDMAVSEERNRLARDLHDSAKQQALAASLELGTALTVYDRDPQGAKIHLVEADALVDSVRKELTNLVDELRPRPVEGQDFSTTLKEHAAEWSNRSGIKLSVNIEGDNGLTLEEKEILFRITQEALANIARHSSASHAAISLEYGKDSATLTITDNGRGFDPQAQYNGIGLRSMRERAETYGGSFAIESSSGKGTQISVTLPKKK